MDRAQAREIPPRWWLPAMLLLGLVRPLAAAGPETWKFDVLRLKSGGTLTGILLEVEGDTYRFRIVNQRPGQKTRITTTTTIQRGEIASFSLLSDREREGLQEKLKSLDPTGKGERARMEEIVLKDGRWLQPTTNRVLCYASDHFILISNANEEIIRRVAVRLEDIYAAYTRFLPSRINKGKKTRIYLVRSGEEYLGIVKNQGRNILNPAFYDTAENQILCKSDLEKLGEELTQKRKKHAADLANLAAQEEALRKEFGKKIPVPLLRTILLERKQIKATDERNDARFNLATEQLFQTLYHEAFHAYLANFVYPPEQATVPRWLNEGLAQIFETAIVEAGEIRVGHVDKDRYQAIRAAARDKKLLGVPDLLKSGSKQFLVAHAAQTQLSDRYYLNSWSLAFYLTFERRLLGTREIDQYVRSLKRGGDEVEAFRILTGAKSLAQFERDYRDYLLRLQPDGTLTKRPR